MLGFRFLTSTLKTFIPTIMGFPPLGLSMNVAMDIPCVSDKRHITLMSCTNKRSFFTSANNIPKSERIAG